MHEWFHIWINCSFINKRQNINKIIKIWGCKNNKNGWNEKYYIAIVNWSDRKNNYTKTYKINRKYERIYSWGRLAFRRRSENQCCLTWLPVTEECYHERISILIVHVYNNENQQQETYRLNRMTSFEICSKRIHFNFWKKISLTKLNIS